MFAADVFSILRLQVTFAWNAGSGLVEGEGVDTSASGFNHSARWSESETRVLGLEFPIFFLFEVL